jgi:hypothetical protein
MPSLTGASAVARDGEVELKTCEALLLGATVKNT